MKVKMYCFAAILSGLLWITASAEEPKTFTVKDGAAPWNDRENYFLGGLPERLKGTETLPQQSCSSRSIVVPGKPKLIIIGVFKDDMTLFHEKYPAAKATGETFSVVPGLTYHVVTLADPQSPITASFSAGLVLLKIDVEGTSPQASGPLVEWPKFETKK